MGKRYLKNLHKLNINLCIIVLALDLVCASTSHTLTKTYDYNRTLAFNIYFCEHVL